MKEIYSLRVELLKTFERKMSDKAFEWEIKLTWLVRALLEAWTSGDKRAEAIVAEWLEKKEAE